MDNSNPFNLYGEMNNQPPVDVKKRTDLKVIYFQFLHDFREHVIDFVRESNQELVISELVIGAVPVALSSSEEIVGRYITVKNQGDVSCFISTSGHGGFRLEPGEKERFWMNQPVYAQTEIGVTVLGIIQS